MLSYQHIYHAGNFADAHKHALLAKTLRAMTDKAARVFALDTHAGEGIYDLSAPEAQKKKEYANGVSALWQKAGAPVADWAGVLEKHNPGGELRMYPGSPRILMDILRPADRLVFCELHPGAFSALQKNCAEAKNVQARQASGLEALREALPPAERRGIVVIDPPYEIKSDYAEVPRAIAAAHRKWPKGVFFLWYPLLTGEPHMDMLLALRKEGIPDVLVSEVRLARVPAEGFAMYGSGVAVINPPLTEQATREAAEHIAALLPAETRAHTFWLDNVAVDRNSGKLAF